MPAKAVQMVKETTMPEDVSKPTLHWIVPTRNREEEHRASTDFVNEERCGDRDNQAQCGVAEGELELVSGEHGKGSDTYTKLLRL